LKRLYAYDVKTSFYISSMSVNFVFILSFCDIRQSVSFLDYSLSFTCSQIMASVDSDVQSTVLGVQRCINLSFRSELKLDSYLVLDRNTTKLLTSDQILFCLKQSLKLIENTISQYISCYFPFSR
jgi:hypothetical protein